MNDLLREKIKALEYNDGRYSGILSRDMENACKAAFDELKHRVLELLDQPDDRPMRAKILEWAQNERNDTQRESGILLAAIIEALDAQTASQEESIRLYRLDLRHRGIEI